VDLIMVFQVEIRWDVKQFGPIIHDGVTALAKTIRERSRRDIAGGLHHPDRFVKGLTTKVSRISRGYAVQVLQRPAFAKVWEYGGISTGKPLLWLPLAPNRMRLRSYGGKLFRPPGKRVLIAASAGTRIRGIGGTGRTQGQVKYVGVTSITHRKRFHLRDIAVEEANKFVKHMAIRR
jgi:hypothetical protein